MITDSMETEEIARLVFGYRQDLSNGFWYSTSHGKNPSPVNADKFGIRIPLGPSLRSEESLKNIHKCLIEEKRRGAAYLSELEKKKPHLPKGEFAKAYNFTADEILEAGLTASKA